MAPILQQSEEGRLRILRARERVAQYMDDMTQEPAKRRGGVPESFLPVSFGQSADLPVSSGQSVDASSATFEKCAADASPLSKASSDIADPNSAPGVRFGMTEVDAAPNNAAVRKRAAMQDATVYNNEVEEGDGSNSSSAAPPSVIHPPVPPIAAGLVRERLAEVSTEDLDDAMADVTGLTDIMSMHVGKAYTTNSDGSICEVYSPPRVVPNAEK